MHTGHPAASASPAPARPDPPSTVRRGGARSRRGGVPTTLPPAGEMAVGPGQQLAMPLGDPEPRRERREVLPDVVLVPDWLGGDAQRRLVGDFRRWAQPPAGLRRPRVPTGHLMGVQSVCLGWHWQPYAYTRTADDTDGAPVKPMPAHLVELARVAVAAAYGRDGDAAARDAPARDATARDATDYAPDAAIVNFYAPGTKLGIHQDGEEPSPAPVVTLSLGDTAVFRFAGVDRRTGPFTDVELRSGDLLVFGGRSRRIFHGVPKLLPHTGSRGLGLPPGRLSITVRETGLS